MDRIASDRERVFRRRTALGFVFLPLRCVESLVWWIADPWCGDPGQTDPSGSGDAPGGFDAWAMNGGAGPPVLDPGRSFAQCRGVV